ncbi:hypothetical protein [Antrihabitans cavernicola]|uniref:Uncharacterized protein n=1 Tax=Antrihabitans cavernicola TaxID=2495913 RepID=A0A5A7SCZ5_9NOCA|nr:hypothetical protein [Spelaeibacter cavernicola]KAA0024028.1 hypothetical protein FOY51_05505 [Spelaeibacter cavernicola]
MTVDHLANATLLAVDQYFDLYDDRVDDDFRLPDNLPPAVLPRDGLALCGVLRSASKLTGRSTPLGIALRSGELDKLTLNMPQGVREPFVATQHDLEWVFPKAYDEDVREALDPLEQIVSLATAMQAFPADWSKGRTRAIGADWVGATRLPWSNLAVRQINQCRPPLEVAESSAHGLAWLRWLATRILPFPTFLLSDVRVAALLGVTPLSLKGTLASSGSGVANQLRACIFEGPLSGMQPRRFWRAGIIELVESFVMSSDITDSSEVGRTLVKLDGNLLAHEIDDPVVCIDRDYRELDTIASRDESQRLAPDGWPPYADPAWALSSSIESEGMDELLAPRAGFMR